MQNNFIVQFLRSKFGKLEKSLDGQEPMWVA
jgi:hypothetical protein